MTPHERCAAALAGRPVDRPPRYIPGIACDVASALLGRPVHTGTGSLHYAETLALMRGEAAHREFEEAHFQALDHLNRHFDVDVFREPWRQMSQPARQLDEFRFLFGDPDGDYTIQQYCPESGDFGPIETHRTRPADPEADLAARVAQLEADAAAGKLDTARVSPRHEALWRRYGARYFVPCNGGGLSLGIGEESFLLIAAAPDLLARQMLLQARHVAALGCALAATPCPRVLVAGGDLAGVAGPLYSPASFRRLLLPALRWLMPELAAAGVHYVFRSDGNLWPFADMLFGEARCPGYGEVDRDAGMTVAKLRARFPELVIWNNISSSFLASATPAQVREECRRCIGESGGTRYFHGPSNAILKGTPPANVEALFAG